MDYVTQTYVEPVVRKVVMETFPWVVFLLFLISRILEGFGTVTYYLPYGYPVFHRVRVT